MGGLQRCGLLAIAIWILATALSFEGEASTTVARNCLLPEQNR